jgi:hypothetical protein
MRTRLRAAPAVVALVASGVPLASGPALAASITKCTTIAKPGSYELTRNLTAAGDCLVIAADFVTIDLGGWVITGDGSTGLGVTDQGNSRQGIAVRNGAITGFLVGVRLGSTTGAVVEKVRVAGVEESGISAGADSIVSDNIVFGAVFGISAGPDSIVSGNVARSNDSTISAGEGSIVSDNVVSQGDFGLSAGALSTVSGHNVGATDVGIIAGRGSLVSGNNAHPQSEGEEPTEAFSVRCPSNVIGNTATGNRSLSGEGCTNIDNLAP